MLIKKKLTINAYICLYLSVWGNVSERFTCYSLGKFSFFLWLSEENTRKAQQLAEAVASGAKLDRKVYRIRNKEVCEASKFYHISQISRTQFTYINHILLFFHWQLVKAIGEEYEIMKLIHRASKATIGLIADAETNLYSHSYLDLLGTVEEVQTAEELILDEILAVI